MTVWEFLLQIAGFAVQTAPVALLMYVSFDNESLAFSRRKATALTVLVTLLGSVGFGFLENFLLDHDYIVQAANLYMTAVVAAVAVVFWRAVKTGALPKLLVMSMCVHYAAILFTVTNLIKSSINVDDPTKRLIYSVSIFIIYLIITAVTLPLLHTFGVRVVRPALRLSDNRSMRRGFIYTTSALVLYCVAVMIFDNSFSRENYSNEGIAIFFTALILTDCILYYMFFSEAKLVIENEKLSGRLQSFDEQYRRISRSIEDSRRMRHDMRHHINAIIAMNNRGEHRELTEYLEEFAESYSETDSLPLCGYHALDNILRYYISVARDKKIAINTEIYPVRSDMDFNSADITVLAGNLMENAVEACEQLPEDADRFIRIWIKQTEVSLLLRIDNSCRADLSAIDSISDSEKFVSTKHSKNDGQGLKSIRLAAEKYGGSAEFKRENGRFTARIVLNIP